MLFFDNCCCSDAYDACCDRWCPSIGHDTRDCIFNCGCIIFAVLAVGAVIALPVAAFGIVHHPSITVEDASLTEFAMSSAYPTTTALTYNISLALRVRNPNWAMSLKSTEKLEVDYSFAGQRFDGTTLEDEGEVHPAGKSRVYPQTIHAVNSYLAMGSAVVAEFDRQRVAGVFHLDVALTGEVKYAARPTKCKLKATCPLKLQLVAPHAGAPASVFQKVLCEMAESESFWC